METTCSVAVLILGVEETCGRKGTEDGRSGSTHRTIGNGKWEWCARGGSPPWNRKNPRGMEDEVKEWNGYVDQMCHQRPSAHILLVKTVCRCFELRPQYVQTERQAEDNRTLLSTRCPTALSLR